MGYIALAMQDRGGRCIESGFGDGGEGGWGAEGWRFDMSLLGE